MSTEKPLAVIRGGGDLGTGVALRLHRTGWRVLITERPQPLVIRRAVALASAVYEGAIEVEGAIGRSVTFDQIEAAWQVNHIPVIVDADRSNAARLNPIALVDAIVGKRNTGTAITDAPLVVGLGPGFTAGVDCHAVVETNRGHNLGRVYYQGQAEPDTGTPGEIGGEEGRRVLRAPTDGVFYAQHKIGDVVQANDVIGRVITVDVSLSDSAAQRLALSDRDASRPLGAIVKTKINGVVRGLLHDGLIVLRGTKIADVDPRGKPDHCYTVSDKAWAVGGGVLEAVLHLQQER